MSFTYKETEEKIKKYYESLKVIGRLKHRLEVYRKRKADIERKIEYKNILESLYKYNKGTLQTSMNYNMDKSTVSRRRDKVIREVMKWLNFYN